MMIYHMIVISSQPVRAIAIEHDPKNQYNETKCSLDSKESKFSTKVGEKRKFTCNSHTGKVVEERRKEESKEEVHTP